MIELGCGFVIGIIWTLVVEYVGYHLVAGAALRGWL